MCCRYGGYREGYLVCRPRLLTSDGDVARQYKRTWTVAHNLTSLDAETLAELESMLGLDFCSYCTTSTPGELSARFKGEKQLSSSAESALQAIFGIYKELITASAVRKQPVDLILETLAVIPPGKELPLANAIRTNAGGDLYRPEDDDSLVVNLQQIAVNIYPLFLIPPSGQFFLLDSSFTIALRSYPVSSVVAKAILADADLGKLHTAVKVHEEASAGELEAHQALAELSAYRTIEAILGYAFYNAAEISLKIPSVEDFCREVRYAIETARKLIRGHRVLLPVSIGLANIKLSPGTVIESEAGRLSEHSLLYNRWIPPQLRENVVNLHSDQGENSFNRSGDIILHTKQKSRLSMNTDAETGQVSWTLAAVEPAELPTRQTIVCLAATLGIDYDPPIAVNPVWRIMRSPISNGPLGSWREITANATAPLRVLSAAEANGWRDWISKINTVGLGTIDIAARRLQSAIAERTDAVDRFVDSVVAWENLFGGSAELRLRISCSLAWLLGDDANHRRALQEQAIGLYILRNKVVHGAPHLGDAVAADSAASSLRITINALRKLYQDCPQMVGLSAEKRSLSAMLQVDLSNEGS